VAYAIQGQVERVSERTFVITPSNISIDASQIKEARRKNSGNARNDNLGQF
jgi:FtsZ-interacting cell division protein YlmF